MNKKERIFIAAWVLVLLFLIVSIPIPVHKVNKKNKCCSAAECAKEHHHEKRADEPLTNAQLQLWYESLNEDYFLGQLPKNTEIRWSDLTALGDMGITMATENGYLVLIDRASNPSAREAELTLAHEACHIKTWNQEFDQHGSKFQNCMVNLATHGAFEKIW